MFCNIVKQWNVYDLVRFSIVKKFNEDTVILWENPSLAA